MLFDVLSSGEYDADLKAKRAAAKSAASVTKDSAVIPASASISEPIVGGSRGDVDLRKGDVDLRAGRPGAVVQPLMVGHGGIAEDKDYRHADVYRSAHDVQHHGESQHGRDWKRRSPQRTV